MKILPIELKFRQKQGCWIRALPSAQANSEKKQYV
jgi:hypothetical protein